MKSKFFLAIVLLLLVVGACNKSNDAAAPSKKDRLCAHTWKYYQYYINYNEANTQLVYSINKQNNQQDLSKARIKYNTDGTYVETDETGASKPGTYKLSADEMTIDKTSNNTTTSIKVPVIDDKNFQWTSLDVNTVAVMIPE